MECQIQFRRYPYGLSAEDERLGWTGDIALFAPTAAYNFDMSRFFDKWLKDLRAEQNQGGGIPMIVPMVKIPGQFEMMFPLAADHWGDACILVPWAEYKARGDIELLRKMYPSMKKYIKHVNSGRTFLYSQKQTDLEAFVPLW